jgi:hypothetical protein
VTPKQVAKLRKGDLTNTHARVPSLMAALVPDVTLTGA